MTKLGIVVILWLGVSLSGCAGLETRTEGRTGPIAWRVTDVVVATKDIQGQAVDAVSFTLEIRNVSERAVTFTQMERTVYRPGSIPGSSSHTGRWELRPSGEWKLPLYSTTSCRSPGGCLERGTTQRLWRIVLTGEDDQRRPVQAQLDITLPPQPVGRTPRKRKAGTCRGRRRGKSCQGAGRCAQWLLGSPGRGARASGRGAGENAWRSGAPLEATLPSSRHGARAAEGSRVWEMCAPNCGIRPTACAAAETRASGSRHRGGR